MNERRITGVMPEDERQRVAVVCHSARISTENNFTVTNYVNQEHNSVSPKGPFYESSLY